MGCFLRLFCNVSGATIIEYALIGALVFLVAAAGISALGDGSTGLWVKNSDDVVSALSGS